MNEKIQNVKSEPPHPIQAATKTKWITYSVLFLLSLVGYFACSWWALETRTEPRSVTEKAPSFTLANQASIPVTLSQATAKGPVILIFYRGHW